MKNYALALLAIVLTSCSRLPPETCLLLGTCPTSRPTPAVPTPTLPPVGPTVAPTGTLAPTATPSPTSSPEPTLAHPRPSARPKPPTLARWGNGLHGQRLVVVRVVFPQDGKSYLAFYLDSTRHYVVPPGKPSFPDVCDLDHGLAYWDWCFGRDWDNPAGPVWTVTTPGWWDVAIPGHPYQHYVRFAYDKWIKVRTCPPTPDTTVDGIVVPHRGDGCFTNGYMFPKGGAPKQREVTKRPARMWIARVGGGLPLRYYRKVVP